MPRADCEQDDGASSWSLTGRIARWFSLTTSVLVLLLGAAGTVATKISTSRELEALLSEELEETRLNYALGDGSKGSFLRVAKQLQRQHPTNPMAWLVRENETGTRWAVAGDRDLQALLVSESPQSASDVLIGEGELNENYSVQIALLGEEQSRLWKLVGLGSLIWGIVGIGASWVVGLGLGRKLSAQLHSVAANVEAGINSTGGEVVGDPPEEIRRVEAALKVALMKIRKEQESARWMSAGLAHELRSPIQNITGAADVALLKPRSASEYVDVLQRVARESRELGVVVDNLVALIGTSSFETRPAEERFDLSEELSFRLARDIEQAREQGVSIQLALPEATPIHGDREAILLALRNIIGNAIRWAGNGGEVRVRLHSEEEQAVRIEVEDSGPGIPRAERDKVFEPFYRSPDVRGKRSGYGLGLALARTAILAHGGSIEVGDSGSLGGAEFIIELGRRPRVDSWRRAPHALRSPASRDG